MRLIIRIFFLTSILGLILTAIGFFWINSFNGKKYISNYVAKIADETLGIHLAIKDPQINFPFILK